MSTKLPKPTQTILKQNHSKIEELANNPVYKLTDIEKIIGVERHSLANYISYRVIMTKEQEWSIMTKPYNCDYFVTFKEMKNSIKKLKQQFQKIALTK